MGVGNGLKDHQLRNAWLLPMNHAGSIALSHEIFNESSTVVCTRVVCDVKERGSTAVRRWCREVALTA